MRTDLIPHELKERLEADWPSRLARIRGPIMAAPGVPPPPAPGGGQPPAPVAPPAPAPAPAPPAPAQPADPWAGALSQVDEAYRPLLQPAVQQLQQQLGPQIELAQRLQPLGEHADTLLGLLNDVDQESGGNALAGLLEFYNLTGDPNRVDDFYSWWEQVGDAYNFWSDGPGGEGGGGEGGQPQVDPNTGEPIQQPQVDPTVQQLQQTVQELQQRLDGNDQQTAVQQEAAQLRTQLEQLMTSNGIVDDENAPPEQRASQVIARLAMTYSNQENALDLAVAEYMRLTGRAETALVTAAGQQVQQVGGGGAPGPALGGGGGQSPMEPEPVQGWKQARTLAMARLRAAEGGQG